jgi:hypothetical protein
MPGEGRISGGRSAEAEKTCTHMHIAHMSPDTRSLTRFSPRPPFSFFLFTLLLLLLKKEKKCIRVVLQLARKSGKGDVFPGACVQRACVQV